MQQKNYTKIAPSSGFYSSHIQTKTVWLLAKYPKLYQISCLIISSIVIFCLLAINIIGGGMRHSIKKTISPQASMPPNHFCNNRMLKANIVTKTQMIESLETKAFFQYNAPCHHLCEGNPKSSTGTSDINIFTLH